LDENAAAEALVLPVEAQMTAVDFAVLEAARRVQPFELEMNLQLRIAQFLRQVFGAH
jgi:hypothetical protein